MWRHGQASRQPRYPQVARPPAITWTTTQFNLKYNSSFAKGQFFGDFPMIYDPRLTTCHESDQARLTPQRHIRRHRVSRFAERRPA